MFLKLLKEAIENIGMRSKENSIAGFSACENVPFNLNKLLHKFLRNVEGDVIGNDNRAIVKHLEFENYNKTIDKKR